MRYSIFIFIFLWILFLSFAAEYSVFVSSVFIFHDVVPCNMQRMCFCQALQNVDVQLEFSLLKPNVIFIFNSWAYLSIDLDHYFTNFILFRFLWRRIAFIILSFISPHLIYLIIVYAGSCVRGEWLIALIFWFAL